MSNSGKGKKKSNLESGFKQKPSVNADASMSSAGLSSFGGLFDAGYRGKSVEELVELASEITPFKPVRVVR